MDRLVAALRAVGMDRYVSGHPTGYMLRLTEIGPRVRVEAVGFRPWEGDGRSGPIGREYHFEVSVIGACDALSSLHRRDTPAATAMLVWCALNAQGIREIIAESDARWMSRTHRQQPRLKLVP